MEGIHPKEHPEVIDLVETKEPERKIEHKAGGQQHHLRHRIIVGIVLDQAEELLYITHLLDGRFA